MNTYTLIGSVLGAVLSEEPLCTLHFRSKLHSAFPCKRLHCTCLQSHGKKAQGKLPATRDPLREAKARGCGAAVRAR